MEWPVWRLWLEKDISLRELREDWSLDDVLRANAILDMKLEQQMAWDEYQDQKNRKARGSK